MTKFEIIRFDKGRSTSHHIAFYDTEIVAQAVANAMNALDHKELYGRTVVLEPQAIVPPMDIPPQMSFCCEKCDQLV